jgi:hypothetical protein
MCNQKYNRWSLGHHTETLSPYSVAQGVGYQDDCTQDWQNVTQYLPAVTEENPTQIAGVLDEIVNLEFLHIWDWLLTIDQECEVQSDISSHRAYTSAVLVL